MTGAKLFQTSGPLFMFSFFRRGTTAKIMLVFLGLALFAMVVTGFGTGGGGMGGLGGGGTTTVASVEGETITAQEVTDQVQRQLARARQQQPELDMGRFLAGGALEEIIEQMIGLAANTIFGRDQGLAASKEMIDREIAGIPAFQNLAGQYDPAAMQAALQREGMTEQELRDDIAAQLIQRQLLIPVAGSAHVPQGLAHQYASLLLESRSGMIGVVPAQAMGPGREPTGEEVAAFYRENQARYTVPERRVVRYAVFGPQQVANQIRATDAEIAAAYQANPAYQARESRRLSQVVLPDEAAARAFVQSAGGGGGFAQAASRAGFSAEDTNLGELTREALVRTSSEAVANAAFSAARGAVVGPIRSELGWHVLRVEDVVGKPATPLASVRSELAAQIEQQKAQNAIADLAEAIEGQIEEGATLAEIAQARSLQLRETPPVTATGQAPGNPAFQAPPELAPLLKTAFDMEANEEPVVEPISEGQAYAVMTIGDVTPAAAPPLAQIADRVKADLVARRAVERARAVAASIVAKINAGTPPAQAFREAEVQLPAPESVSATRREIAREGGQVPPPLAMLFSLPRGKARLLAAPNGAGWFVVALQNVVPGDAGKEPGLAEAVRGQFAQVLGDEYGRQFSNAIRAELEVKRNEDAVRKLRSDLPGGVAP